MKVGRNYSKSDRPVADDNLIVEGFVGIGTTSPTVNLQIIDAAPMISLRNSDQTQELFFEAFNNDKSIIGTNTNNGLAFWTSGDERMRITKKGGVKLGTGNPRVITLPNGTKRRAALDINLPDTEDVIVIGLGGSDKPDMIINKGGGTVIGNGASDIYFSANGGIAAENGMYFFIDADNNDSGYAFHFRHNGENKASTDDNELMLIKESGDVGIGTTNPKSSQDNRDIRLDVANNIITNDVYLRNPKYGSERWASEGFKVTIPPDCIVNDRGNVTCDIAGKHKACFLAGHWGPDCSPHFTDCRLDWDNNGNWHIHAKAGDCDNHICRAICID
jgi:hypothetical protein